jgi:hypothetical protein
VKFVGSSKYVENAESISSFLAVNLFLIYTSSLLIVWKPLFPA